MTTDKCKHPADALVIKSFSMNRDISEIWTDPHNPIRIPGKIKARVDVRCALCGQGIVLEGEIPNER